MKLSITESLSRLRGTLDGAAMQRPTSNVAMRRDFDIGDSVQCLRYYAGWADKIQGKTIEVSECGIFLNTLILVIDYRTKIGLYKARTDRCYWPNHSV